MFLILGKALGILLIFKKPCNDNKILSHLENKICKCWQLPSLHAKTFKIKTYDITIVNIIKNPSSVLRTGHCVRSHSRPASLRVAGARVRALLLCCQLILCVTLTSAPSLTSSPPNAGIKGK